MTTTRRHRRHLLGQVAGIVAGLLLIGTCAPALGDVLAQPAVLGMGQDRPQEGNTAELVADMWASGPTCVHMHGEGGQVAC